MFANLPISNLIGAIGTLIILGLFILFSEGEVNVKENNTLNQSTITDENR